MNPLLALAFGVVPLLVSGAALAQSGSMMGGYGGFWMPLLLVVAVVAIVVLIARR